VVATHRLTGVPGRGTEEMKTNDITNRYDFGEIGFSIEIGRPGVGTLLKNIELFTTKLSILGVIWEKESPVTALLTDHEGHINPEVSEERVLSAIIEFKVSESKVQQVLKIIRDVEKIIDTVFTVGVVTRLDQDNSIAIIGVLENEGFPVQLNAKINIGLGKL
jgi:hypothetical protein